ncbi:MAG: biotin-dependent carboxyltransferase family protein [Desulfobacteraceae bacterium]|nr:biotin-dependent carboxyltransferase family protein [Desulfobacteraceae bacterium]
MESMRVLSPGGYTTVQDLGRFGYQEMGIPITGSLDLFASAIANLLVGNPENSAVLEITVIGPVLEILASVDVAITGANIGITVNDRPMLEWQSIRLVKGDILSIQQVKKGCRAYLAVNGGIDVPQVMGSYSTYTSSKLGGFQGRVIEKGDILESKDVSLLDKPLFIPDKMIPDYLSDKIIRAIPGPQDNFFEEGLSLFFGSEFLVTPKANRMGYRLLGPTIEIKDEMPKSIVSESSVPGSVQIPADGQPIILLVEQTVGGYAKIATIISSDIPKVAQSTPGDTLQFQKIDIKTAHHLYIEQMEMIEQIKNFLN